MSLDTLTRDVLAVLATRTHLDVHDIVALSSVNRALRRLVNENNTLWCSLCCRWLGSVAPETRNQMTTTLGLASDTMTWADFFRRTYGSTVLTWGWGAARTGHEEDPKERARAQMEWQRAAEAMGLSVSDDDTAEARGAYTRSREECIAVPTILSSLSRCAISAVGKTAEVGSVATSLGGRRAYLWGTYAHSNRPVCIEAAHMSPVPHDRIVDASCGHDTGFLFVFASGYTCCGASSNEPHITASDLVDYGTLWHHVLLPDERPVQGLGSQSSVGGVLTNKGRVLQWSTWEASQYARLAAQPPEPPPEPMAAPTEGDPDGVDHLLLNVAVDDDEVYSRRAPRERPKTNYGINIIDPQSVHGPIDIVKCAFGHRWWFAIGANGWLYGYALTSYGWNRNFDEDDDDDDGEGGRRKFRHWTRVAGTEHIEEPIICVDSGSDHHVLCTASGDAYTWGCTSFGMLGHGAEFVSQHLVPEPKLVQYFRDIGKRVVACGAGGYLHWQGMLGAPVDAHHESHNWAPVPVLVDTPDLRGRLILSIACGEDWAAVVASARDADWERRHCQESQSQDQAPPEYFRLDF